VPPIDFNGLDTAVHGPLRLGVLSALRIHGALDFTTLKKRLETTDGALGMHLHKLEEIGYITCKKAFVQERPKSTYRISARGKQALEQYLEAMQRLIDAIEAAG
jgi:DNA-binding PadR family transcriptional regulator